MLKNVLQHLKDQKYSFWIKQKLKISNLAIMFWFLWQLCPKQDHPSWFKFSQLKFITKTRRESSSNVQCTHRNKSLTEILRLFGVALGLALTAWTVKDTCSFIKGIKTATKVVRQRLNYFTTIQDIWSYKRC